ncbi:MAG: glycosyltransferase family 2 protein, partial [Bacteroidales bacterium]|nr:glycosyltransferase family 2 protein [Bacteroidales bacterium]
MKKDVAVIILNWNSAPLLRRYLPGVLQNTNPDMADVIVADNGSTDASRQVLEEEFPQVPTILLDKNYGYAEGYNKSIAQATGYKYTVLLNSDVRTPQGWLEPLYRYMDEHPQVGAVQPKVLQDRDDGRQVFDYAGAAGGYLDKHGYPYCRGRLFSTIEDDHGQYDSAQGADVFWASGACLMVRTALYREVGGLDSAFFAHMEEIDLCWRIWRSGHRISLVTDSSIYHLGGGSLPQGNPFKTYLNFRNNLLMLYKNLPRREGRSVLLVRRLYDALAFF